MIEAVIFDMDGLLIDSEPFWQQAEKKGFDTVGVSLTTEMCQLTMGQRIDDVIRFWFDRHPWTGKSQKQLAQEIVDTVIQLVQIEGKPMPGVSEVIEFFQEQHLHLALASSSFMRLIDAVVNKLKLRDEFQAILSAEHFPYGKPHPEIFLKTAEALNILPERCLVVEDSISGVIAGKAAGMKVIAVPEERFHGDHRFTIADQVIPSLECFNKEIFELLNK